MGEPMEFLQCDPPKRSTFALLPCQCLGLAWQRAHAAGVDRAAAMARPLDMEWVYWRFKSMVCATPDESFTDRLRRGGALQARILRPNFVPE